MELDSALVVEYLQPFITTLLAGFGLATIISLLGYGIHKAFGLFYV